MNTAPEKVTLSHGQSLSLPGRCACCLAPTTATAKEWVNLGGGYRRELALPECARCSSWKAWGLGLGFLTVLLSGAAGLAAGVMLFPEGALRIVPLLAAIPLGIVLFIGLRRALHPRGHVPHCSAIASAETDPSSSLTRDIHIRFANPQFAALWRAANGGDQ